jgi:hypothetical protein
MGRELQSGGARFLANLAYLVPVSSGYRERGERRDEDSRLRSLVLRRLTEIRGRIAELLASPSESTGAIAIVIAQLEERGRALDTISDAVRYAPYGFSGFFDASAVREDTLDRLLESDLLLFEDLDRIEALLEGIPTVPVRDRSGASFLAELDAAIERLERHLILRDKVLGDA